MKVLLATCMPMPHSGGASTHFELLGRALASAGLLAGRVVGQDVALSRMRKLFCALRARGAKDPTRVALLRDTADLLSKSIDASIESASAGLVHCHDALSTYAALNARAVMERSLPVVQTVHGPWSREMLTSGATADSHFVQEARRIEEVAYATCTRFIAVDRGQADILGDDFGVARERVTIIHNAVDFREIQTLALSGHKRFIAEPYFVVPRRLVPKNGVRVAIEAIEMLGESGVQLAIAGDGPLAGSLRHTADDAMVSRRVHFLGNLTREQLMPLMAASAGVIVPSVPCNGVVEATSLSVIESFACDVPVVASNIGGLAELIQHGSTGLLFPAGDARALAGAMNRLLQMTASERTEMCAAARDAALERWDIRPWLARVLETYSAAHEASASWGNGS
jgi:glycosyltransferase involved in cell wall biosynthesis